MSKNMVKALSERFIKASVDLIVLYMKNDGSGGRRAGVCCDTCYCELRDLGEVGLAELRRLMTHPNMAVRLAAASLYRWVDRYEGLKVLQELKKNKDTYPVGSFEREVAFTAYSVFALSTKPNPCGEDPYIAWQKAKEDKAKAQS